MGGLETPESDTTNGNQVDTAIVLDLSRPMQGPFIDTRDSIAELKTEIEEQKAALPEKIGIAKASFDRISKSSVVIGSPEELYKYAESDELMGRPIGNDPPLPKHLLKAIEANFTTSHFVVVVGNADAYSLEHIINEPNRGSDVYDVYEVWNKINSGEIQLDLIIVDKDKVANKCEYSPPSVDLSGTGWNFHCINAADTGSTILEILRTRKTKMEAATER